MKNLVVRLQEAVEKIIVTSADAVYLTMIVLWLILIMVVFFWTVAG